MEKSFNKILLKDTDSIIVLVQKIDESKDRNGNPYCKVRLSDGNSTVEAKIWNMTKDRLELFPGKVYDILIKHDEYSGVPNWIIHRINGECNIPATDFIIHAPITSEIMWEEMGAAINSFPDDLRNLCNYVLNTCYDKVCRWPAAKNIHHAFYQGLTYHTYRMFLLAKEAAKIYSSVNKNVLFCSVILHDIGKVCELDFDMVTGITDYTTEGDLLGHTLIAIKMISDAKVNGRIENTENILMVEHCIASHHGIPEYGAIKKPATMEAQLLHLLDLMDSRMEIFEEKYNSLSPGEFSEKIWSLETKIYKPNYDKEVFFNEKAH